VFGTTKLSSKPITSPYPSQVGHAPYGLLKLNKCVFGSRKVRPSNSNLLLKGVIVFKVISSITHFPLPS
jgi:hypothetical protein